MFGAAISLIMRGFYVCLRLRGGRGGSFPRPLTPEEEHDALKKMEQGDRKARETLILHNMRLVAHVIKKFYTNAGDQEDLISIGTVGLLKAIDSYKSEKCAKLPTYACKCIQNEIFMHFRGQKKRQSDLYLNDHLDNEGDGVPLTVMDVLQSDDYTQERLEIAETYAAVAQLVEELSDERMRKIIKMRYGMDGLPPRTQRETADSLGISRSYVSRIEKKALGLLEQRLREMDG
ncbi:MAG: sigma-70 family RNA polymerase sigma factor [Oscillospiraceae bacterium]|nr:sigma-70 family RNA polymerase sigma factor [Oscillospiraceae bacterium]